MKADAEKKEETKPNRFVSSFFCVMAQRMMVSIHFRASASVLK